MKLNKELTKNIYIIGDKNFSLEPFEQEIGPMSFISQFFVTTKLEHKPLTYNNENIKYLYKYTSGDNIEKLINSKNEEIIKKMKQRILLKDDANDILQHIKVLLLKKIEIDSDFTNDNDVRHTTYILYPTIIDSELGKSYLLHTITVYETGVIEYNMYSTSKCYYLMVDSTPALFNAEINYFNPHKNSYINKNANTMDLDKISELHFKINASKLLYKKESIDITRFKYYLANFEVALEDKVLRKMKKLVLAPLDPRSNYPFHKDIEIHNFHQLYFFGNNNCLLLFTPEIHGEKVIDKEEFLPLYFSVYPSTFPLLIDIHATIVTMNYHNKNNYTKNEYINLKNKLNDINRTKKRFIAPKYRSIYKLSGYLNEILNIDIEVIQVENYLKDMRDYIDFDLKIRNEKSNFKIQIILMFLSLITIFPLIFDLNTHMYIKIFLLTLLMILIYILLQDK